MLLFIKKTILGSLITAGALLALIFVFGSLDPLKSEIAPKVPTFRRETVPTAPVALSQTNITQEIAKEIAKEIVAENPEGPNTGEQAGLATVDPEQLTQDVLATAFAQVKIEDLKPTIALADLVIIKSNEKALAEQYFQNINKIINKNFPAGVSINFENPAETNFSALINAYALSMSESLAVAVPANLAPLHREYISLLGAEKNTFVLIKNYLVDPAQAVVALEAGEKFTGELAEVLQQMNAYIAENNLIITT
ncbi:MAG: hypothetical protein Q7R62_02945 [bacterium]|nr:hypothetical protein [bacterium]